MIQKTRSFTVLVMSLILKTVGLLKTLLAFDLLKQFFSGTIIHRQNSNKSSYRYVSNRSISWIIIIITIIFFFLFFFSQALWPWCVNLWPGGRENTAAPPPLPHPADTLLSAHRNYEDECERGRMDTQGPFAHVPKRAAVAPRRACFSLHLRTHAHSEAETRSPARRDPSSLQGPRNRTCKWPFLHFDFALKRTRKLKSNSIDFPKQAIVSTFFFLCC